MPIVQKSNPRRAQENPDSAGEKRSYIVREGHTVTTGEQHDGENAHVEYGPGETVSLTKAEAGKMPWAVDPKGSRKRDGQVTRLQRKVAELTAQIRAQQEALDAANDPESSDRLEEVAESIKNRGDNFIGRGEPEVGKVPAEVVDAFDRGLSKVTDGDGDDPNDEDGDEKSLEEISGGMKGLGKEKASSPVADAKPAAGAPAVPSTPKPGKSVPPASGGA